MYLQTLPVHRHGRGFITGVCALPHTAMQGSSRLPESRRLFPFLQAHPAGKTGRTCFYYVGWLLILFCQQLFDHSQAHADGEQHGCGFYLR